MLDSLYESLVDRGLLKAGELASAIEEATTRGLSVAEVLAERGILDERELYGRIAACCGLELAEAEGIFPSIDAQVARSVSERYQERKRIVAVRRGDGVLTLATSDPELRTLGLGDAFSVDRVEVLLVTPTDFRRLRWAISLGQLAGGVLHGGIRAAGDLLARRTVESRHRALLDALVVDAVGERASDLHLERYADLVRVRLRIDGDLHDVDHYRLTHEDALGVINVLKIRSGLDISERRLPQDGRFEATVAGRVFDVRVNTLPCLHGEGAAIRLLPQDRALFSLEGLGWSAELLRAYRGVLRSPSGLVLVVGPTGCGKSTTLYAGLQLLAAERARKVVTAEDPIEYAIANIAQTQIRPAQGYAFPDSVRAFVRHDPDVIFVGEIRDTETAREALRASQTGHLVLSTLHANDAVDAVQRMYDLGMHPNSIAAELLAVFSQRLIKRLCESCRELEPVDPEISALLYPGGAPADLGSWRGAGCPSCRQRGTHGRLAVGEYLPSTRDLRIAVSHQLPLDEIRAVAAAAGLRPMREHALELAARGAIRLNRLPDSIPAEQLSG